MGGVGVSEQVSLWVLLPRCTLQVVVKSCCHKPLAGRAGPVSPRGAEVEEVGGVNQPRGAGVRPNEAESLFMELRIIFMIISTFLGSGAALPLPPAAAGTVAPTSARCR